MNIQEYSRATGQWSSWVAAFDASLRALPIDNGVAVFYAQCGVLTPGLLDSYWALLSEAERQRNQRYRFQRDRNRDLLARALTRCVLAGFMSATPVELAFEAGEHGKPGFDFLSMDGMEEWQSLAFNLSHAGDWVVLAVTRTRLVGVDIEASDRDNDVLQIADRYFFGRELEELQSFPAPEQRSRFFDYWTLKEAYMKARGEGISLGLDKFGFRLRDPGAITIALDDSLEDNPRRWQFALSTPVPDYRLAIAYENPSRLPVSCWVTTPLVSIDGGEWRLV